MKSVAVLLSTYNGESYLEPLIDSILRQEGVEVRLYVRDDGSSDKTCSIVESYVATGWIELFEQGQNLGYAKSFWRLLRLAQGADYYAFADQDDIWCSDKLSRAVETLDSHDGPCLYTSSVIPVDNRLIPMNVDVFPSHGPLSLEESLQRSILPGCTFVLNGDSREIAINFNGYMESHDWAMYAIVTLFGTVKFDQKPGIMYRLHDGNAIGVQSSFANLQSKITRLFAPSNRTRSRFAQALLDSYGDGIPYDKRKSIEILANCNQNLATRFRLAFSLQYKGVIFRSYALLGRI